MMTLLVSQSSCRCSIGTLGPFNLLSTGCHCYLSMVHHWMVVVVQLILQDQCPSAAISAAASKLSLVSMRTLVDVVITRPFIYLNNRALCAAEYSVRFRCQ